MQKIKLFLLSIVTFLSCVANAETTTDKVVISPLTVIPGGDGDAVFTVSLEGSLKYFSYQIVLELPEGLEVCVTDGEYDVYMLGSSGFYPRRGNSHALSYNVIDGLIKAACIPLTGKTEFSDTSGDLFEVYVKATPYLKPGDVEIGVKDVKLMKLEGELDVAYVPDNYVSTAVQAEASSTLTLKVSASNQYSTCILPFDYELPTDGSLIAYTCDNHTEDALLLTKADKIEAYTPYILYSKTGFSATITGTVDPAKYPEGGIVKNGHLVGTVVKHELAEGYVMQNQGAGAKFYRVADGTPFSIPAGKCYVEMPAGTNVSSFRFAEDTGIDNVEVGTPNRVCYNVLGQRVSRMTAGQIYIMDGHKVIAE